MVSSPRYLPETSVFSPFTNLAASAVPAIPVPVREVRSSGDLPGQLREDLKARVQQVYKMYLSPQHYATDTDDSASYQYDLPHSQVMLAPTSQPRISGFGHFPITRTHGELGPTHTAGNRQQTSTYQGAWQGQQHFSNEHTLLRRPMNLPQSMHVSQATTLPTSRTEYRNVAMAGYMSHNGGTNMATMPTTAEMGAATGLSRNSGAIKSSSSDRDLSSRSPPSLICKTGPDQSSVDDDVNHNSPNSAWDGSDPGSYAPIKRTPSFCYDVENSAFDMGPLQFDPGAVEMMGGPYFHNSQLGGLPTAQQLPQMAMQWNQANLMSPGVPMLRPGMDVACQAVVRHPQAQAIHSNMNCQHGGESITTHIQAVRPCPTNSLPSTSNAALQGQSQPPATVPVARKREDVILLEGKRHGLTYKEIRKKIGTDVAESTLRGRYRSLTKARKDRVRKPVWTEKDISLLRQTVRAELDRLNTPGYRHTSPEQRLAKISWKRVADYIVRNGGSYHFGNSTCKKKWTELCEEADGT